jgi:hypothetical protein
MSLRGITGSLGEPVSLVWVDARKELQTILAARGGAAGDCGMTVRQHHERPVAQPFFELR